MSTVERHHTLFTFTHHFSPLLAKMPSRETIVYTSTLDFLCARENFTIGYPFRVHNFSDQFSFHHDSDKSTLFEKPASGQK
jgi:hypothetical protein